MASVDLAASSILRDLADVEPTYWRLWDQAEWLSVPGGSEVTADGRFFDPDTGMLYENLRGRVEELLDADCVIYWGDFHHLAAYQRDAADILSRHLGVCRERTIAGDFVARHLLLRGRPDREMQKVFSYGTTLGLNSASDYAGSYGDDLFSFIGRCRQVWFRDPYSAVVAEQARPQWDTRCFGVDAALLLPVEESPGRTGSMGVYFGRSSLRPEAVARFGRLVARCQDLRPEWIHWGREPAFWPMGERRRFRLAWPALEHKRADPSARQLVSTYRQVIARRGDAPNTRAEPAAKELLRQLATHSLVVTDTYHLAVNAWRVGTPAVCVIDSPRSTWSVNSGDPHSARDKRRDLYSTIEALGLLVDTTSLWRSPSTEAARIGSYLGDEQLLGEIRRRMSGLVSDSRGRLVSALEEFTAG